MIIFKKLTGQYIGIYGIITLHVRNFTRAYYEPTMSEIDLSHATSFGNTPNMICSLTSPNSASYYNIFSETLV